MAQIAFEGNTSKDVDLKFSQSGKAVAKVPVAENHRGKDQSGEWQDVGTTWHNVTAFGALAEKLAEVPKGTRITVQGRQASRSYDKDGEKRQWTETIADVFGVVPKRDQAQSSGSYNNNQASPPPQSGGDPWAGGSNQGGYTESDAPF